MISLPIFKTDEDRMSKEVPVPELENDQLSVNPELVWDLLLLLNLCKFIRPDGIHLRVVN